MHKKSNAQKEVSPHVNTNGSILYLIVNINDFLIALSLNDT